MSLTIAVWAPRTNWNSKSEALCQKTCQLHWMEECGQEEGQCLSVSSESPGGLKWGLGLWAGWRKPWDNWAGTARSVGALRGLIQAQKLQRHKKPQFSTLARVTTSQEYKKEWIFKMNCIVLFFFSLKEILLYCTSFIQNCIIFFFKKYVIVPNSSKAMTANLRSIGNET